MARLSVSLFVGRPLLDIASYARRGPGRRDHLSPAEIAHISRTVKRVEANATERSVRGQSRAPKLDSIYRAAERGCSSYMTLQARAAQRELATGAVRTEGESKLRQTRATVVGGWNAVGDILRIEGRHQLAHEVGRFVSRMEPARTGKEWLAHDLIKVGRRARTRDRTPAR